MESRRKLVIDIVEKGVSISAASRAAGVTRNTAKKWLKRALEVGDISKLSELSRAPKKQARATKPEVVKALLDLKGELKPWGAGKLVPILARSEIILSERTAERILKRHGLTVAPAKPAELQRFEREEPGMLLQMDFKGLPHSTPYSLLTVLDDCSRMCLAFAPLPDKLGSSVRGVLWDLFGVYGLPDQMLMDNGDCWGSTSSKMPTRFEIWLMKLKVQPIHGRPHHPGTQGKVERFHKTAKLELGQDLFQPSIELAKEVIDPFVHRYNTFRPHDSLAKQTPSERFRDFPTKRPAVLPEHYIQPGAVSRKVDQNGFFTLNGKLYKAGKGLIGERLVIAEAELGDRTSFNGYPLAYLFELPKS